MMEGDLFALIFSTVPQFAFATVLFYFCDRNCNRQQERMMKLYETSLLAIKEILKEDES